LCKGILSPPHSPPLASYTANRERSSASARNRQQQARREGAAYTIAGECERLFCEILKAVFLGEGNLALQDSLAMGMHDDGIKTKRRKHKYGVLATSPKADPGVVEKWIEVWDYVGGVRFRGFLASNEDHRAVFVFFDDNVLSHDLKPG
jgi:hypothetical protein